MIEVQIHTDCGGEIETNYRELDLDGDGVRRPHPYHECASCGEVSPIEVDVVLRPEPDYLLGRSPYALPKDIRECGAFAWPADAHVVKFAQRPVEPGLQRNPRETEPTWPMLESHLTVVIDPARAEALGMFYSNDDRLAAWVVRAWPFNRRAARLPDPFNTPDDDIAHPDDHAVQPIYRVATHPWVHDVPVGPAPDFEAAWAATFGV